MCAGGICTFSAVLNLYRHVFSYLWAQPAIGEACRIHSHVVQHPLMFGFGHSRDVPNDSQASEKLVRAIECSLKAASLCDVWVCWDAPHECRSGPWHVQYECHSWWWHAAFPCLCSSCRG